MKKLSIIILCLLVFGQVLAQKFTKKLLVISYYVNPEKPLDESLKRYDVVIKTPLDPLSWSEEVNATVSIKF